MPALGLAVLAVALLLRGSGDRAEDLASQARSETLSASERNAALNRLRRIDGAQAMSVARELLQSPAPNLRLSAAWIWARGGDADGERVLVEMVENGELRSGFRGMAAVRLARLGSTEGRRAVVKLARTVASPGTKVPGDNVEGLRWELLDALGRYGRPEDLGVALSLYRATELRAPARPVGLFGRPESLPTLREAALKERNAGSQVQLQLAIARSGGEDGAAFVRKLLTRAAVLEPETRAIDLQKEDPLSGRLAADVLWDLGSHTSDEQFREDVIDLLRQRPCQFCEVAWAAIARIGIGSHEAELIEIASRTGESSSETAMKVLAYRGAVGGVRVLAKRMNMADSAQMYIAAHEEGRDRDWFPVSAEID